MKPLDAEDYKVLEEADVLLEGAVASVLNRNGCANWTVCPMCGVDDFTHVEGCSLGPREEGSDE